MMEKKWNNSISWELLLMMILGTLVLNSQTYLIVLIAYFALLVLRNKKICIPKIPGFKLYLIFILYAFITGVFLYSVRYVFRDLYYLLPTILWIFIGTYFFFQKNMDRQKLFKTIYLFGGILSVKCFVSFLLRPDFNFNAMRAVFGSNVYEVGFILPILALEVLLYKRTVFSKKIDRFLIIVMLLQVVLSFGRIALLQPIIIFCVFAFLLMRHEKNNMVHSKRIFGVFVSLFLVGVLMFYVLPETTTNMFLSKFLNSFQEIDATQDIYSVGDAMSNWRAYEVQVAQRQWMNDSILVKLFGAGLGKGVELTFVPHSWQAIIVNNEIPLLHNGFYTLLPKGGLFAVFALLWMFIGTVWYGIKKCRRDDSKRDLAIILVGISIAAIANTYVVRGPVKQGAFIIWAVLIGWLCTTLQTNTKHGEELRAGDERGSDDYA